MKKTLVIAATLAALLAAASPSPGASPSPDASPRPAASPSRGAAAAAAPAPGQGLVLTAGSRTATLACEPKPHGTHPLPLPACTALSAAGGDFDALPGQPGVCQEPYQPVTVTARGDFRGQPVNWRKKFANACVLKTATGPVFAFAER